MEGHLEALLEMDFYTKPPNFGVEANMKAPAGDALTPHRIGVSLHKQVVAWTSHFRIQLYSTFFSIYCITHPYSVTKSLILFTEKTSK
jgi:hypothetical protein